MNMHCPAPLTVFLVEDDDGDAKAVARAFRNARVANPIIRAKDGVEALEFLRGANSSRIDPPFIMLVDVNMPRMSGHQLVSTMRADAALKRHVVFMLTTSRDVDDIETAYDNNVAGYIVKEDAGRDFLKLVSTLEDIWTLVQMPMPT